MRYSKMLRRQAQAAPILAQRDFLGRVASYIDKLEAAVKDHRLAHDVICEASGEPCNCGADDHNKPIDNLLADGEMDTGKRSYR